MNINIEAKNDEQKNMNLKKEDVFEPVLGEIVSDDSFAFTLLSCHCSSSSIGHK
jgi:hypothetical protein